jgi:geranylgeranyl diphosphate synthase type II
MNRIDAALMTAIAHAEIGAPPLLASALRYAVFPGGARVRPRLCLAVAEAYGCNRMDVAEAAACAIELQHCASLVHDDLPCFDDADLRRGKASVHRMFGEAIAVLTGDALIVLGFETLARATSSSSQASVGTPYGLVAGQAWESEPSIRVDQYHRAKTASLFVAATTAGAIVAGADPAPWRAVGERLGAAYQVADDLLDALAVEEEAGKPVRQDAMLGRPSAVKAYGVSGAVARLRELVTEAAAAIPDCAGAHALRELVLEMAERLIPASLRQAAA